jgi:hypothetical protein
MAAPRTSLEFPEMLRALAEDVETLRLRLRGQLHSDGCKGGDPTKCCIAAKGSKGEMDPKLPKMMAEVVNAAKALGGELRQWDGHIRTNMDSLSPSRKAAVLIQFIQSLSLSGRRDVYAVLAKHEQDRPDGLGLTITDRFAGSGDGE